MSLGSRLRNLLVLAREAITSIFYGARTVLVGGGLMVTTLVVLLFGMADLSVHFGRDEKLIHAFWSSDLFERSLFDTCGVVVALGMTTMVLAVMFKVGEKEREDAK